MLDRESQRLDLKEVRLSQQAIDWAGEKPEGIGSCSSSIHKYLRRVCMDRSETVVIPKPTLADARLDRLVHTAYRLHLLGESQRKLRSPTLIMARTRFTIHTSVHYSVLQWP